MTGQSENRRASAEASSPASRSTGRDYRDDE